MRERQSDGEGEHRLLRCQRVADRLVELANLPYTENNLREANNSRHTHAHTN